MDFELTAEQELARRTAREFAEAEIAPVIARYDEAEEFPAELVAKLGALGFMGALFPPEYGGAGLDYVAYALVVEELSRVDGSVGHHDVGPQLALHEPHLHLRHRRAARAVRAAARPRARFSAPGA